MTDTNGNTKDRIIQAAEHLFAECGISATSLRHITARAGVNLAAVNYHFGSRDALIETVYARRLQPLNDERLARLGALEADAHGRVLPLEAIIRAFVEPVIRIANDPVLGGPLFIKLFGQSYTETSARFERFFTGAYRDVLDQFAGALARSLPQLPREELYWRLHFMIGATAYTIGDSHLLRLIAGSGTNEDVELTLARLIPFLVAGFQADAAGQVPSSTPRRAVS